jgi:hypothetical protein
VDGDNVSWFLGVMMQRDDNLFNPGQSIFVSFALRPSTSDALFDYLLDEIPETRKVGGREGRLPA